MLIVAGVVTGIAVGLLYGLLAFSIVLLYKATGVANFAQGSLGTASAFILYGLAVSVNLPMYLAVPLAVIGGAALGALCYVVVLRPVDSADHLNLTIRTLALYMLMGGILNVLFKNGTAYRLPGIFPTGSAVDIGAASVTWLSISTIVVATVLVTASVFFFKRTSLGLQFEGLATSPEVASLLGVRVRRLTLLGWAACSVVSLVVACLVAPTSLLASNMLDSFLLFSFAGAIIGGLTSLTGAFVGGIAIGVLNTLVRLYADPEAGTLTVFALVIVVLLLKPNGIFGKQTAERF